MQIISTWVGLYFFQSVFPEWYNHQYYQILEYFYQLQKNPITY